MGDTKSQKDRARYCSSPKQLEGDGVQGVIGRVGKAEVDKARRYPGACNRFVQYNSPSTDQQRSHLRNSKPVAAYCSLRTRSSLSSPA